MDELNITRDSLAYRNLVAREEKCFPGTAFVYIDEELSRISQVCSKCGFAFLPETKILFVMYTRLFSQFYDKGRCKLLLSCCIFIVT